MYDEFKDENWIPKTYFSHWSEDIDEDLKNAKLPVKELYSRNELDQFYDWCSDRNNQNEQELIEKGFDFRKLELKIFIISLPKSNDTDKIPNNYKPR